jgi:WD40 repeat protein
MSRAFISYASVDLADAEMVRTWLVDAGHEVFLSQDPDDGLVVGDQWRDRLHERLRWADVLVCVVSGASAASKWCAIEIEVARSRGIRILPVYLEEVDVSALRSLQRTAYLKTGPQAGRNELLDALRRADSGFGGGWPDEASPFPGLRAFTRAERRVFFGRGAEVGQLAQLVRSMVTTADESLLTVLGPSGCGKSSLVAAGLLPALAEEPGWWVLGDPIRPGSNPVGVLVRRVVEAAGKLGLRWTDASVRDAMRDKGFSWVVGELLAAAPPRSRDHLVIAIDQYEELLTQAPAEERARFVGLVRQALQGGTAVVATLRPEFLDESLLDPVLSALPSRAFLLRPIGLPQLRSVIEQPARVAGISVDEQLVSRLVEDTGTGDALPLLAFTLSQLAEGLHRGGQLSVDRYERLGGVKGALVDAANAALNEAASMTGGSNTDIVSDLLRLVTIDEQGRPTRLSVQVDGLPDEVVRRFELFIERRLLSIDSTDAGLAVTLAHEAVLSAWPPLADAIKASASALRTTRSIEIAAAEWEKSGRPRGYLWSGGHLAGSVEAARIPVKGVFPRLVRGKGSHIVARPSTSTVPADATKRGDDDAAAYSIHLTERATRFLQTSLRRDRLRRERTLAILMTLLLITVSGAVVALVQTAKARTQQQLATGRQLVAEANAVVDASPLTAVRLSIAAYRLDPSEQTYSNLYHVVATTPFAGVLPSGPGRTADVAFDRSNATLVSIDRDGRAAVWDTQDIFRPHLLANFVAPGREGTTSASLAVADSVLVSSRGDGPISRWSILAPSRPVAVGEPFNAGPIRSLALSPRGEKLVTLGMSGTVELWGELSSRSAPSHIGHLATPTHGLIGAVSATDNAGMVATVSSDDTMVLWGTRAGSPQQLSATPVAANGLVTSVDFAPSGRIVAVSKDDGTVDLWDVSEADHPRLAASGLGGHTDSITSASFSPNGALLATTGADGTTVIWDVHDPNNPKALGQPLTGHDGSVIGASLASDGATMVTVGADGKAVLWRVAPRPEEVGEPLNGHVGRVDSLHFDGRTLTTNGTDGQSLTWNTSDSSHPQRVGPARSAPSEVTGGRFYDDDGTLRLVADATGGAALVAVDSNGAERHIGNLDDAPDKVITAAAFTSDKSTLITATSEGSVDIWNIKDPTRPSRVSTALFDRHLVTGVALVPRQPLFLTSSTNGLAVLWDFSDQTRPRQVGASMDARRGPVGAVAVSQDGLLAATGYYDGSTVLWDLTEVTQLRDTSLVRACVIARGGMPRALWKQYLDGIDFRDTCDGYWP